MEVGCGLKNRVSRWFLASPFARASLSLVFIFALGLIFNADGTFFHWDTHRDMLRQISTYGILASGLTVVTVTGGIDLSVGSVLALSAVVFSILTMHKGWTAGPAIMTCLVLGLGFGRKKSQRRFCKQMGILHKFRSTDL
jgi:ribose transport system permease protein